MNTSSEISDQREASAWPRGWGGLVTIAVGAYLELMLWLAPLITRALGTAREPGNESAIHKLLDTELNMAIGCVIRLVGIILCLRAARPDHRRGLLTAALAAELCYLGIIVYTVLHIREFTPVLLGGGGKDASLMQFGPVADYLAAILLVIFLRDASQRWREVDSIGLGAIIFPAILGSLALLTALVTTFVPEGGLPQPLRPFALALAVVTVAVLPVRMLWLFTFAKLFWKTGQAIRPNEQVPKTAGS